MHNNETLLEALEPVREKLGLGDVHLAAAIDVANAIGGSMAARVAEGRKMLTKIAERFAIKAARA